MAHLIEELATGSRKSDGTANASGKVYAYQVGTLVAAVIYSDDAASIAITQPLTLNAGGQGIAYTTAPIRLLIQDSAGTTVQDIERCNGDRTELVQYDATQASAAFTGSTVNQILQLAKTSFGGVDWNYLASSGATAMGVGSWMTQIVINAKAYGAKGDNATDDTAAIQAAVNYAAGLPYGAVVYLPAGIYRTSAVLALSTSKVSLRGAGQAASVIRNTSATGGAITVTSASDIVISDIGIDHTSSSTGIALAVIGCSRVTISNVYAQLHQVCFNFMDIAASSTIVATTRLLNCQAQTTTNASSVAVRYGYNGTVAATIANSVDHQIIGGKYDSPTGTIFQYRGTPNECLITGTYWVSGATGVDIQNDASAGAGFVIVGNTLHGTFTDAIKTAGTLRSVVAAGNTMTGTTSNYAFISGDPTSYFADAWARRRPFGNEGTAATQTLTATGNFTVDWSKGNNCLFIAAMAAGAQTATFTAPTNTSGAVPGSTLMLHIKVTTTDVGAFVFNSPYKAGGGGPSVTAGNTSIMTFVYDGTNWRQSGYIATTT